MSIGRNRIQHRLVEDTCALQLLCCSACAARAGVDDEAVAAVEVAAEAKSVLQAFHSAGSQVLCKCLTMLRQWA